MKKAPKLKWEWKSSQDIAKFLYKRMDEMDMTVMQLAEKAKMHKNCIEKILGGMDQINEKVSERLGIALDFDPDYLKNFTNLPEIAEYNTQKFIEEAISGVQEKKVKQNKEVVGWTIFFLLCYMISRPWFWLMMITVLLIFRLF